MPVGIKLKWFLEQCDMSSDDPTKELPDSEPEENKGQISDEMHRMFSPVYDLQKSIQDLAAQFATFSTRLDAIEQKQEQRQLETKPIWEKALQEITETRYQAAPRPVLLRAICFNDQRLMLASALSNVNKSSRSRLMTRKARRTCGGNSLPLTAGDGARASG